MRRQIEGNTTVLERLLAPVTLDNLSENVGRGEGGGDELSQDFNKLSGQRTE